MTFLNVKNRIKRAKGEGYDTDAAYLFAHALGRDEGSLAFDDGEVADDALLTDAIDRYLGGEPLQYILGRWTFYRQTYLVNENCLIPRPDTETLLEKAVEILPKNGRFIDLCTGSGCIAISLACERPDLTGNAWEKNDKTLALAVENARLNGVDGRLSFALHDVLTDKPDGIYDAVLSNPPYIERATVDTLDEVVLHEPRMALDGGEDGLDFYRAILRLWYDAVKPGGSFIFEIGYNQKEAVSALGEALGLECTCIKDYGGNDRVVIMKKE